MSTKLRQLVARYDPALPIEKACTIPSAWYTDRSFLEAEKRAVFARNWQAVGRCDQLALPGQFITTQLGDQPIVVVRGEDGVLRALHNVCSHHAAEVVTAASGKTAVLRCPYHGWTYGLDGCLKGAPEFGEVCDFDRSSNGLKPLRVESWENFIFVVMSEEAPSLEAFLGNLRPRVAALDLKHLRFFERRHYQLKCNWKVFVDNYLDGGYHVPHIHHDLNSVLDYSKYTVEIEDRYCAQISPINTNSGNPQTAAVRHGDKAFYYWLYPNFMINWYEGVMDTNFVIPLGVDCCEVIFDFYFSPDHVTDESRQSIIVSDRVQQEDVDICESVQRGLRSQAYDVGRLSVSREAGEHLFHRLLHADMASQA